MRTATRASQSPTLEVDGPGEELARLGLARAAEALGRERSEAVRRNRTAHGVLERPLASELARRDGRRVRTALRPSGRPPGMTLGESDSASRPSVERRPIEAWATRAFVREPTTLLIQGPPGVGGTHSCVGLGVKANEDGSWAAFHRPEGLLHERREDAPAAPRRLRRLRRLRRQGYLNVASLVVDEVGFEPMSREGAVRSFRLVSSRYRRGGTALTTNQGVKGWPGIFAGDGAPAAAAPLGRRLPTGEALDPRGRGCRLQELLK